MMAAQGIGIDEILEAVVQRIPPPQNRSREPLRALIFDSYYDSYKARAPGLATFCAGSAQACAASLPLWTSHDLQRSLKPPSRSLSNTQPLACTAVSAGALPAHSY